MKIISKSIFVCVPAIKPLKQGVWKTNQANYVLTLCQIDNIMLMYSFEESSLANIKP